MKFTVAATVLSSPITATAASLSNTAEEPIRSALGATSRASNRNLAVTQHEISDILKERRASKNRNGKVIRNLQNKLKNSKLRNQPEEYSDISDSDLDFGLFSRNLQNFTEPEEEETVIDGLIDLCSPENAVDGFSCSCSNVDVGDYTANVICSYDENCLDPTQNSCGGNATFCFVETYELEMTEPGTGSSKICYEVNSPMEFTYCYGLTYTGEQGSPSGCFLEFDGNQCNSCEITLESNDPNITCNVFDCTNVEEVVGTGYACGDDTIVSLKIEDYLVYKPLPCEGGCNLCPQGGKMMNPDNSVTLITGEEYYCHTLNLIAQMGYLQGVPGDLCNALPAIVDDPCECTGSTETSQPVDPASGEDPTDGSDEIVDVSITPPESPDSGLPESASACAGIDRFGSVALLASIFSWMMA